MLKIIRSPDGREIAISIREKRPFLTSALIRAFGITMFLHITMGLIFHIQAIKTPHNIVHPPIIVKANMDIYTGNNQTTAIQVDKNGLLARYVLEPGTALPILPETPTAHINKAVPHTKAPTNTDNVFTQLERAPFSSDDELVLPFKHTQNSIKVDVSGYLADFALESYSLDHDYLSKLPNTIRGSYVITFYVQVEGKSGKIFWHSINTSSQHNMLDNLAEKLLQKLDFQTTPDTIIADGEVSLTFLI